MTAVTVDVNTSRDGTVVIHLCGALDATDAVGLRRTLVHTIQHTRPLRLVIDLADVHTIDPINLGTVVAAFGLGADHQVAVFLDHPSADLAGLLTAAGVPRHLLRHVG
jgi:anti-anti-sigma factor